MKVLKMLLILAILTPVSCTIDDETEGNGSVSLTATGLSDGKLALNNAATFIAEVVGYEGNPSDLGFRWTLATEGGELSDGRNSMPNNAIGGNSIACIGKTAGDEQISVELLDGANRTLATASYAFTILPPTDPVISRGCFDQPKIIYQYGTSFYTCNYDGSGQQYLGVRGGLSTAISPDGEWIAWNDDSDEPPYFGWDMYVQRCDGSEKTKIPGGTNEDFLPLFSPDSKTLYFLRPEPSQKRPSNGIRPLDIAAYELESGQLRFLTTIYQQEERVGDFTVSPVTGEIAFFRKSYQDLPGGAYQVTTRLSFLQPEGGLIRDFTTLPPARYDYGLDWSPDGKDIIFSARIDGQQSLYRINVTDGSQPLLVFHHLKENSVPPLYPHYYAGGSRIVWGGQENGQNSINLWSVDANGGDMQQITDLSGTEFLQGVLH